MEDPQPGGQVQRLARAAAELDRGAAARTGRRGRRSTPPGRWTRRSAAFERCERGEPAVAFGEIYIQTGYDPSPAPEGKHLLSVFGQYAPYEIADGDWDAARDGVARQFIDLISRFAPDLEDCLADHEVLGPPDIESRIGLTGGNIFQGEVTPDQMWEGRLAAAHARPRPLHVRGRHPPGRQRDRAQRPQRRRGGARRPGRARSPAVQSRRRSAGRAARLAPWPRDARERILEAACDLIAAEGIDDVRIARVATRAGASTALVHHYFSTREELLEQALIHSFEPPADERFGERARAASGDRHRGAGRAIRDSLPVPGPPGARVGAVGRALAARRARPGAAAGRRAALRALPRLARGRDPGRGRERRVHAGRPRARSPTTRWRCSTALGLRALLRDPRWTSSALASWSRRACRRARDRAGGLLAAEGRPFRSSSQCHDAWARWLRSGMAPMTDSRGELLQAGAGAALAAYGLGGCTV